MKSEFVAQIVREVLARCSQEYVKEERKGKNSEVKKARLSHKF